MKVKHPRHPRPRPFSGVYLAVACTLDAACPGFLTRLLYASDLRRAAVFAAVAEIETAGATEVATRLHRHAPEACPRNLDAHAQVARALLSLRAREIVRAVYGDAPDGFLGLLARLGADPLPARGQYRLAYDLFADPRHRARARLLRQTPGRITSNHIEIAARLDAVLLHRKAFERVQDPEQIETLHAALALVRALVPQANDEALHRSLDGVRSSHRDLGLWVERWLWRMTRLPIALPIPADDPDVRVLDGPGMVALGRRFRNCARDRLGHIATGLRCYLEWTGDGGPAVIELRCLSAGYLVVEDLRGPQNRDLDLAVSERIRAKLAQFGVLGYAGAGHTVTGSALMGLLGVWHVEPGEPEPFLADLLGEAA